MKVDNHPLESVFNIQSGSMDFEIDNDKQLIDTDAQPAISSYVDDEEDQQINSQLEEIYEAALIAFKNQQEMAEIVDPRFAARNSEIAAQFLSIALNSTNVKSRNKVDKRKLSQIVPQANTISNSNIIMADRNAILEMIKNKKD